MPEQIDQPTRRASATLVPPATTETSATESMANGTAINGAVTAEIAAVRPVPLTARLRAYVALTKPRIIELLLVTAVPSMVAAAGGVPSLGLVAAVTLAHGSLIKAIAMVVLGLLLGCIGIDVNSGVPRLDFGMLELADGIEFVAIAMGVFAFTDIVMNWRKEDSGPVEAAKVTSLMPNREEFRKSWPAAVRGTILGSILGLLPGGGATLSSFASYSVEKRLSRNPEEFGRGAPAGVAGPETANNAGSQTSFIPMLTLGIPSNGVMALMIGAMMIHDVVPGPQIMTENAPLFWGLVVSMWIGNLMLLVLNLPMVGLWVRLLRVKYDIMAPVILIVCLIGLFSIQNQAFEIYLAAIFAVVGYLFRRMHCEPAPLLLGFILGPMLEENLRRALLLARGDAMTFVERPISAILLAIAFILLALVLMPSFRQKREEVFAEEEA